jgi:hypothetical protein
VGLRRLLTRQPPAADPVAQLAELGREQADPHPTAQFAGEATRSDAAPISVVRVEGKAADFSGGISKREPRRRPPSYVWLSEKSHRAQSTAAGVWDMKF